MRLCETLASTHSRARYIPCSGAGDVLLSV
nr:MAG TPA: hypothetical protein [Caudoviricetes sp.]